MINASYVKLFLSAVMFLMALLARTQNLPGFDALLKDTYKGSVPLIYADSLVAVMDTKDWVVLDARELEEYEVSHLSNALFVGYENFSPKKLGEWPKASNIVVYCSVGYRSERVGEQLIEAGFEKVYHLRGGIFEWINTGNPVVDESGNRVKNIHPYNESWGKWVNDYNKVYE